MSRIPPSSKYKREFFARPPDDVARDLVSSLLVLRDGDLERCAMIVEVEAYGGDQDPASHAFRGPTRRNSVMFGPAGHLYVYRIYGLHWCMNVVTESEGCASAVLLRAVELFAPPLDGEFTRNQSTMLRGPGNLTSGLGVTGADNGRDVVEGSGRTFSFHKSLAPDISSTVLRSPRIGISRATDRPSRYFLKGHRAVSGTVRMNQS